jgi:hypothetical protein
MVALKNPKKLTCRHLQAEKVNDGKRPGKQPGQLMAIVPDRH